MSPPRVLLTGATGYVGGTILHQLATSTDPLLTPIKVTALVRGPDRAAALTARYGADRVNPVLFKDFEDLAFLEAQAAQHDVVVNAGTGFHPPSAEALVKGLAAGREGRKDDSAAWMVHTSGCSNISDKPVTGASRPDTEWLDSDAEGVYNWEKAENKKEWYPQRASELAVLDSSLATEGKVHAVSLQIPNMCGTGEGMFQRASLMIPIMMGYVLSKGYGFAAGDGTGVIDWVHISDVAALYVLIVRKIAEDGGKDVPRGKKGILFPTVGRTLMKDIAQGCVDVAFESGALPLPQGPKEKEVRMVDLEEAATTTAGNMAIAEMGWAGHRLTKGTVARDVLGWKPKFGEEAWRQDFLDELRAAQEGTRGVTIDNCINEAEQK